MTIFVVRKGGPVGRVVVWEAGDFNSISSSIANFPFALGASYFVCPVPVSPTLNAGPSALGLAEALGDRVTGPH